MSQSELFSESVYDALRDVVRSLGKLKEVGHKLRPELSPDEAGDWLKKCLDSDRRERLNPDQVLWLLREGRKAGCHSLMHYFCDEAGYTRANALEPADEAAELQRQVLVATRNLEAIAKRLERLNGGGGNG